MDRDNVYSQFVAWSKILLPLAALALLSTLFLFSRGPVTGDGDIPFADIEEIARDQRISAPRFAGVATDGSVVTVTAESARPGSADGGLDITRPEARIQTTGGAVVEFRAGAGTIDPSGRHARLSGLARIETSTGYEMETTGLSADLEQGRIESDGALEARAPFGELTAGKLVIETPEGADSQLILFNEGVRLVYRPQQ